MSFPGLLLKRVAARIALRKPSPNRIPLSGKERLRQRDYYTVRIGADRIFYASSVSKDGLTGFWYDEHDAMSWPASIPNKLLRHEEIAIQHYFGELEISYNSAPRFFFATVCFQPWVMLARERTARALYNRKKLFRADRKAVLRFMIDETINNAEFRVDAWGVMAFLLGRRVVEHPDNDSIRNYYRLLLMSLADTGDLVNEGGVFRIAPRAFTTIAQIEESDRRHSDNVNLQGRLVWLTAFLFVVGLLQAWVTWYRD